MTTATKAKWMVFLLCLAGAVRLGGELVPDVIAPIVSPSTPATAAVYVYEKDQGSIPPAVLAGINRLNRENKILATTFEDDNTDGDNDLPEQYKVPVQAAREAGLPALVVTAGDKVLRVVKAPTTLEQTVEATR